MQIELSTNELADIIKRLPDEQLRGLFWYVFGYCSSADDETFFKGLVAALTDKA